MIFEVLIKILKLYPIYNQHYKKKEQQIKIGNRPISWISISKMSLLMKNMSMLNCMPANWKCD